MLRNTEGKKLSAILFHPPMRMSIFRALSQFVTLKNCGPQELWSIILSQRILLKEQAGLCAYSADSGSAIIIQFGSIIMTIASCTNTRGDLCVCE